MTLMMQDKRVLVTGAGRGLGATIAQGFAREGASVIVADLDPALARASARTSRPPAAAPSTPRWT